MSAADDYQTRDLTWDYICFLERQRAELVTALQRIAKYCGNQGAALPSVAHMARTAAAKVQR